MREREKRAWGLGSPQWYFNIFCLAKPKNRNVLTRAFRERRGLKRLDGWLAGLFFFLNMIIANKGHWVHKTNDSLPLTSKE